MSRDEQLRELGDLLGVLPVFWDMSGQERRTGPDTDAAMARAMGYDADASDLGEIISRLRREAEACRFPQEVVIESGVDWGLDFGGGCDWALSRAEDGKPVAEGRGNDRVTLPPMAADVYVLRVREGDYEQDVTVLAAPKRLPLIGEKAGRDRIWGVSAALYGLVSDRNAGLGDYADLGRAAEGMAAHGAAFLGINPVHAMGYADAHVFSPYSPSHRGFLNTSHIALDQVPKVGGIDAKALRDMPSVPYAAHKQAHHAALETAWEAFCETPSAMFEAFCAQGGAELDRFAAYEALSEIHGPDWREWPQNATPQQADPTRKRYHVWLQWLADGQLSAAQDQARDAGMALGLYLDLAVGARRSGAEAWCERDVIAKGVSLGAPPDHLSPGGQNWDLAAFNPHAMRVVHYAPLRRILAQIMRHAGLIRIDHVLGLNRSFWVPDDGSPGAYIQQPFDTLTALIRIEAARHGTLVIGEDLGLVPDGFRETMRGHGFYGYSVLQYEKDHGGFREPGTPSPQVLSCFGTHDTPTLQGYAQGRDIDWWQQLGWINEDAANHERWQRGHDVATLKGDAHDIGTAVHGRLAHSPAAMVCVQLDDILETVEAQNLPGTVDEHQNWQRRYSVAVDDLTHHQKLSEVASVMAHANRCDAEKTEGTNG